MNFKCRVCGCESYRMLFGAFDGEAYCCNGCSSIFKNLTDFSLHRELRIQYLDNYNLEEWGELDYKLPYDSGIDLRAAISEPITIYPYIDAKYHTDDKLFVWIPFGIKVQPVQFDMDSKIYCRSGLSLKDQVKILNSVGVIDSGYRNQVMGRFYNIGRKPYTINPGDRVAQLVVEKRLDINVVSTTNELDGSDRGEGGFGSTGRN